MDMASEGLFGHLAFGPLASEAIDGADGFINIFEGAVRSGKTVTSLIAWLNFVQASPHRKFLLTGKDGDALFRNVIGGEFGILGLVDRYARYTASGVGGSTLVLRFPGQAAKTVYCLGANNAEAEGRVRGMTVGGWYGDEVTLYRSEFVAQALNRMSLPGARAMWTCNPDSPYHPLYAEFIAPAAEKGYRHWHFTLDDNYALDEGFKANLRAAYKGLWYQRMILGRWVMAEGAIYDMLDPAVHVCDALPAWRTHWVGVDYGTASVTCFWLLSLGEDGRLYFSDFWRWDARVERRQMTDVELARALEAWLAGRQITPERVLVPADAASLLAQLAGARRAGLLPHVRALAQADRAPGSVQRRIRQIASLLAARKLLFTREVERRGGLREWLGYVWDPHAQHDGRDAPLKADDHDPDAGAYALAGAQGVVLRLLAEF